MKHRGTLLLFLIALALGAWYMLVELPRGDDSAPRRLLPALEPDAVERVTIDRGDTTLALERAGTHWEMLRPVHDLADANAVMRLLAAAADADIARDIGPQDDPVPYGLDRPVTIRFGRGTAADTLRLGGYTVDRGYVYATRGGERAILLVPTALHRYASAAVEDFRFPRVATFDVSRVDSFRVRAPDRTMSWHRRAAGWFTVTGDDTIRGDPAAVEGILRRLRALRVVSFPPDSVAAAGAERAVTVYRAPPGPPQRFGVIPRGSTCIVTVEPEARVVRVDSTIMEAFDLGVEDLRDRRLLHFDPAAAARIELTAPEGIITLVRADGDWRPPNPAMGAVDGARVHAALRAAAALEFDRVRSESPPRIDAPTFRFALFDADGTLIDELLARYRPGDDTAVATSRSSRLEAAVSVESLRGTARRFLEAN